MPSLLTIFLADISGILFFPRFSSCSPIKNAKEKKEGACMFAFSSFYCYILHF